MIVTLSAYLISALGAALLIALYMRIRAVDADLRLARHRRRWTGLADLLNYAAVVDDGVVVLKSGALLAAWMYRGADHGSSTEAERERISMSINRALSPLGAGWMVHIDAVRREATGYSDPATSHFPDPVSRAIDEERRRYFRSCGTTYEGYFVVSVTWYPPLLAQRKFTDMMFDDDEAAPDPRRQTKNLLAQFRQQIRTLESNLSIAVSLTRLKGRRITHEDGSTTTHDELLAWLQLCITGQYHPVQLPSVPIYLDSLLGGQEMFSGTVPKIGRKFIQTVAIEGLPLESSPGMLTQLTQMDCVYRWSSRFIFMDNEEAKDHLSAYQRKWKQKIRGFLAQVFHTNSTTVDEDAVDMADDASAALAEVSSGLVGVGYYTSVVVLMSEDRKEVEAAARDIHKRINKLGFVARVETINTLDAFFGSLPGHGHENIRRPLINTLNLADLLPQSSIWAGSETAPCDLYPPESPALMHCVTSGSTPFRLNLHVGDVGHTLIFGPTGAGKSVLLATLAAQLLRYPGMTIFAFEKGKSLYALTRAVGGLYFSPGADDDALSFAPFQHLETEADRAWAMEFVESILVMNDIPVTPAHRVAIGAAIMSMARNRDKTFTDLLTAIQDAEIRQALHEYTVAGTMGRLLDAEYDDLNVSNFNAFDIEALMNLGNKYALAVLLYLFRHVERTLHGQPACIILDEAWIMLGHPAFREKIREWLKVLRKANCIVIIATQSLSDAKRSGILDVLVEQTKAKIFLPNVEARSEESLPLYKGMGLNEAQIDILAHATPKRQYYYTSEQGRRLFELALGPLALSLVAASSKDDINAIQKLEHQYGEQWLDHWLAAHNIRLQLEDTMREAA